jgi:hypothetical protein
VLDWAEVPCDTDWFPAQASTIFPTPIYREEIEAFLSAIRTDHTLSRLADRTLAPPAT